METNYAWLHEQLSAMPASEKDFKVEWQWTRYMVGQKMFAAVCKNDEGKETIATFKLEPEEGAFLREQFAGVNPGYYMNKVHWNSVNLDGSVPDDVIADMAKKSYALVLGGLSKKKQKELLGQE